jgi:hypothetical protein
VSRPLLVLLVEIGIGGLSSGTPPARRPLLRVQPSLVDLDASMCCSSGTRSRRHFAFD